jgi:hydrogenase 3 maturation protease
MLSCSLEKLSDLTDKLVLFVGLGNVLRRDDGVGVYLAQKLHENQHIRVLNAEVSIENYIGKINDLNPDFLILIDSVVFNRRPGYCQLMPVDRLIDFTTNTHNISLRKIAEFVRAQTFILGIQPAEITFGEGLTSPVKSKADLLVKKINTCFSCL